MTRSFIHIMQNCLDDNLFHDLYYSVAKKADYVDYSIEKTRYEANPDKLHSLHYQTGDPQNIKSTYEVSLDQLVDLCSRVLGKRVYSYIGAGILKYEADQYISIHKDWHLNTAEESKYHNPWSKVDLACIYYLNDEYSGGEFNVFGLEKTNTPILTYKPNPNSCVIIDSDLYHSSCPVKEGTRYCITMFLSYCDCGSCDSSCVYK